jgi:hypothetical protein
LAPNFLQRLDLLRFVQRDSNDAGSRACQLMSLGDGRVDIERARCTHGLDYNRRIVTDL